MRAKKRKIEIEIEKKRWTVSHRWSESRVYCLFVEIDHQRRSRVTEESCLIMLLHQMTVVVLYYWHCVLCWDFGIHTWRSVFVCGKISFILQFPSILIRITFAFIRISSRVNEKNKIRYGILIEMSMLLGDCRPWHFKWIYTIYFHHFNYYKLILIEPMQMLKILAKSTSIFQ